MKICKKCNIEKELSFFSKNKANKDGFEFFCKSCKKEYNQNYQLNNKNKISKRTKNYYEINKENIKIRSKIYQDTNIEKIKEYHEEYYYKNKNKYIVYNKKWRKIKYYSDISFKILCNIRCRINDALKNNWKSNNTKKLLGCSIEEFNIYLESKFLPEMNWFNHGVIWEIDHIIPCSSFDLTKKEEQKKCFHYTNLQPLFKTTKIAKSFGYLDEIGNRNKIKK